VDIGSEAARLRADVFGGASSVSRAAAELLARASASLPAASSAELLEGVAAVARSLLDAQPAMAPLVHLARDVLAALDPAAPIDENRRRASAAATGFGRALDLRVAAAAAHAARLLPHGRPVLTISASSAVEAALAEAARSGPLEVICLEGRPMNEGRILAAALAQRGVHVRLAVDAALESLIHACGAVLLGADSIGDGGVVNKIGSAAACHAAGRHGVPVYVVADSSKLLPRGFPQPFADDRPAAEVWPDHGAAGVWNRYFEVFPSALASRVVTEVGALGPDALDRVREGISVPPPLRAWAASRA
jgi:translation initiation factor 2B subunit (eIF-2B alpha/beta/delta family)